ncbi:uncharacterized protein LOC133515119 [Syngnathoides biaculeatus]|uniref:uncharacterized protein LOC133515119 n=1 Tax=Syngnathoides biaculeatus TaxID=300417 RepID=UPI002ADD6CD2|nr:uncharacterized protein LOC133515119 [Syngnathoides biaculeatus]
MDPPDSEAIHRSLQVQGRRLVEQEAESQWNEDALHDAFFQGLSPQIHSLLITVDLPLCWTPSLRWPSRSTRDLSFRGKWTRWPREIWRRPSQPLPGRPLFPPRQSPCRWRVSTGQLRPTPYSGLEHQAMREYVEELLEASLIRPSSSPGFFFVKKKDTTHRLLRTQRHHSKEQVREVIQRLLQHQLFVKMEKCEFHRASVSFLGFILAEEEIRMDPGKVDAALRWPTPASRRNEQMASRTSTEFIQNFSSIAIPLHALTAPRNTLEWTIFGKLHRRAYPHSVGPGSPVRGRGGPVGLGDQSHLVAEEYQGQKDPPVRLPVEEVDPGRAELRRRRL